MSSIYGTGKKAKATKMHSFLVRSRGRCELCGRAGETQGVKFPGLPTMYLPVGGLQCAHIIGRRYSATRTDETNAWALCAGCHMRLTEHPDEHMHLVARTIGMDRFHELKDRALAGVKASDAFWQSEVDRLSVLLGEVSS